MKAGLNVGKVSDNLMTEANASLPAQAIDWAREKTLRGLGVNRLGRLGKGLTEHGVLEPFNHWIFSKLSRGAMLQTAITNYERNLARFPELGREGAARRTAKEMNELFGNLGSQGIFKSKTFQDLARLVLLAPQWTESQLRAELRGFGQAARISWDAMQGKLRAGVLAQGMAGNVIALLAANQVINYLSRGKPTWENEEEGHKLAAFIPGGKRGFWFSPFEIAAEFTHAAEKAHARYENPVDILTSIGANKLSPLARGMKDLLTGRDYSGRPFLSDADRFRAAALDAAPFPMPLNAALEKDPRQPLGFPSGTTLISHPLHCPSGNVKIISDPTRRTNFQAIYRSGPTRACYRISSLSLERYIKENTFQR